MRKVFMGLCFFSVVLQAQILPHFKEASVSKATTFGGYFVIGDYFGFEGTGRFPLARNMDIGLRIGMLFWEKNNFGFSAGGDLKFLVVEKQSELPFNLSLFPTLTFLAGSDLFYFAFTGDGVMDFPVKLETGINLIPYFGIGLGIEFVTIQKGWGTDVSPEFHGNIGMFIQFTRKFDMGMEIQFSDDLGGVTLGIGVRFRA